MPALSTPEPRRARVGAQAVGAMAAQPSHPIHGEVMKRLDDTDWAVRRQLAATLGELPRRIEGSGHREHSRAPRRRSDRRRRGTQRYRAAASLPCSIACCREPARRRSDRRRSRCWPRRSCASATMRRCRRCSRASRNARAPPWQRSALLRGAEVALLARRCRARRLEVAAIRTRRARRVPVGVAVPAARAHFPARSKARLLRRRRRVRAGRP